MGFLFSAAQQWQKWHMYDIENLIKDHCKMKWCIEMDGWMYYKTVTILTESTDYVWLNGFLCDFDYTDYRYSFLN
jgi:hypothetical protein